MYIYKTKKETIGNMELALYQGLVYFPTLLQFHGE